MAKIAEQLGMRTPQFNFIGIARQRRAQVRPSGPKARERELRALARQR